MHFVISNLLHFTSYLPNTILDLESVNVKFSFYGKLYNLTFLL